MSQDIFVSLEEHSEDEDDPCTPEDAVEFSGISAGSSFASPLSQPTQVPDPSAAAKSQDFKCPFCPKQKPYKTRWGYERHMKDKHQLEGDNVWATHGQSPALPSTSQHQQATQTPQRFQCSHCNTVLKTRGGFVKHEARHKLNAVNFKKPSAADFQPMQSGVVKKIVEEILAEPNYGEKSAAKLNFLQDVLANFESNQWLSFVSELSSLLFSAVCDNQSKILPLNQYEEAQKKVNTHLNNEIVIGNLSSKLLSVSNEQISEQLANRIVARIAFKLVDEIQMWVAKEVKVRGTGTSQQQSEDQPLSSREEKGFQVSVGNIIRGFYKKGVKSTSHLWRCQSACLKDTFIISQSLVTSAALLNKSNWFSGTESSIVPSDNAISFFKLIENNIKRKSSDVKLPTPHEVIQDVLLDANILNLWFYLTNSHLSEEDSMLFMRELIYSFVTVSSRLEQERKNRNEDKSVRESTVAIRTHLQKNVAEKDDLSQILD